MQVTTPLQQPTVFQVWQIAVTNTSAQCLAKAGGSGRVSLSFHNPGTVDVYVCPATDALGATLTATVGGKGMIMVMAGNTQEIDNPGNLAWNTIAASSAVLTILEYINPTRTA
jgi:hypothetical protein